MTQTRVACPGSNVELSWLIPDVVPALQYHIIIQDQDNNLLLLSDYTDPFGTMFITAPTISGQYTYTITVIRDNYGHLSDTEFLFLRVTQMALTDVFILDNPLLPGAPFTVYWTINTANPQSDELVQVTVDAPYNSLGSPTHFQAFYPNGASGSATFIAPDTVGVFPVTIMGVGLFGCSDVETIMLETEDVIVSAGSDRMIFAGDSTVLGVGVQQPGTIYTWMPNDWLMEPNSLHPIASPLITTIYTVIAFRPEINLYVSDQVTIQVLHPQQNIPLFVAYFPGLVFVLLLFYFMILVLLTFVVVEE